MASLVDASSLDAVYQLEVTDDVVGGAGGVANSQAQALLNRTRWLKDHALISDPAVAAYVAGDVFYATGPGVLANRAIGANHRVLTSDGTAPQWSSSLVLDGTLSVALGLTVLAGGILLNAGVLDVPEIAEDAWTAPTLVNSWANASGAPTVGYYKSRSGRVYLRGTVTGGAGTGVLSLPTGYKPVGTELFSCVTSAGVVTRLQIDSGGSVQLLSIPADASLAGVSFLTT